MDFNILVNDLIYKRLCLPSNISLDLIKNGQYVTKNCECGDSHHIACIFEKNKYFQNFIVWY